MRSQRNYGAFWEWPEKGIKEGGIMKDYREARNAQGLPRYLEVTAFEPDPPDFVARDIDGYLTAIELTELVSREAIQANVGASKLEEYVYRDWTREEVIAGIEERLADKDKKQFHGGPYNEIHLVIHVDEPVISPSEYFPILTKTSFAARQQISRAFLLFSSDPETRGYPLVELQLGKGSATSKPV
jgi:hypothetical protein